MSTISTTSTAPRKALFLPGMLLCYLATQWIATESPSVTLALVAGVLLVLVSFFHTRLAIYVIIFSMLLSPEIDLGLSAGSREATVRLEDLLLILVGAAWLARAAYYKELGILKKGSLNAPIMAYSLAALLATLVSGWLAYINWVQALLFLAKYIEYFVLYFLVLVNLRDRSDVRSYLAAAFLTAAIVSVVGIAQIPTGERVSAPFEGETGEPNTFGGYLVFMMALAGGFFLTSTTTRDRALWLGFGLLMLVPLLYTLSRSSWLAAAAMALVLFWKAPRRSPLLVAGVVLLTLTPLFLPQQVVERMEYTFQQPREAGQLEIGKARLDTSLSARIRSWSFGLEGWTRRPLTGYGVAGYGFMDAQYIRVLTETGLVGFVAFCWLAWSLWQTALKRHRSARDPLARGLALGYLAGYVALLVHGLGANTFIIVRIMEPFWLITALVVGLPSETEGVTPSPRSTVG